MQEYMVTIGGVDHTMQLSDEDAKRLAARPVTKSAAAPANKARSDSPKKG